MTRIARNRSQLMQGLSGLAVCAVFLGLLTHAWAATFTSKAAGSACAGGQTTWNEVGIPASGDTLSATHAITFDCTQTIGASPGEADVTPAFTTTADVTITGALTVRGDFAINNAAFTMSAGSSYTFDPSLSAAPLTTSYRLRLGTTGTSSAMTVSLNGTSGSPVTITSNSTSDSYGYIDTAAASQGSWTVTFANISKLGSSDHTDALQIRAGSTKSVSVSDSTFTDFDGQINVKSGLGVSDNFEWTRNELQRPNYRASVMTIDLAKPSGGTPGRRWIKDSYVGGKVIFSSTGSIERYVLDGTTFASINTQGTGTLTSATNAFLYSRLWKTGEFGFGDGTGTLTGLLAFLDFPNAAHTEGVISAKSLNVTGAFFSHSFNSDDAGEFYTASTNTTSTANLSLKRVVLGLNSGGKAPGGLLQLKGTKFTHATVEHNTVVNTTSANPAGVYTGSGSEAGGYRDSLTSVRSNLFWSPTAATAVNYALDYRVAPKTGTADGTSTTTVINGASGLYVGTASAGTTEGSWVVKMTSGPDTGVIREIASNTTTSITLASAMPNSMAGQTFATYPLDQITTATHNGHYQIQTGTLYDSSRTSAGSFVGYNGFAQTTPSAIGTSDVTGVNPAFVDTSRSIPTLATASWGFNRAANTAWATSTAYVEGDGVSRAVASFEGAATINYRCVYPHTSAAATAPGGFTNTAVNITSTSAATPVLVTTAAVHNLTTGDRVTVRGAGVVSLDGGWTVTVTGASTFTLDHSSSGSSGGASGTINSNWRNYWEFESIYLLRIGQLGQTAKAGYSATYTIPNAYAALIAGYQPTATAYNAAHDTGWIGAVDGPASTGARNFLMMGVGN